MTRLVKMEVRSLSWRVMRQSLLTLVVLLTCAAPGRAQVTDDTEHDAQFWPDVQVAFNLKNRWSVFLFGTMRLGRDWKAVTNEQLGFGVTRRINSGFTTTLSYRRLHTEATPGRHVNEDRVFADATPRIGLGWRMMLVDRNRFEWRRVNGNIMYRYRNRIQIERGIDLRERRVVPYAAFEAFYDTRFQAWSRHQLYTGTRLPLTGNVTLDCFYMHQWDRRALPGYIDVIGAFWRIEF